MINKTTLIGRIGKDPEIKRLESGKVVAKFSLATSDSYKDKAGEWQEQTEWHTIVAWASKAEYVERRFKKGMLIYVEGKLTYRSWKDDSGNTRIYPEIIAHAFRSLEKSNSHQETSENYDFAAEARKKLTESETQGDAHYESTTTNNGEADDDDLPF